MVEVSLLPSEASRWEQAQELTDAARWPLPTHLVKDVWNPDTCPARLLPYLAAGLGLEIWNDSWSEARQREICRDIWRLKRNKTKLKGLVAYAALAGANVVAAKRPRDKMWWSGGQTDAQRAATMAAMPQIQIAVYPPPVGAPRGKKFWSGRFINVRQTWSRGHSWTASDAPARYEQRASYVDGGVLRPVTIKGADGPLGATLRVELRAAGGVAKLFWGARRFWGYRAAYVPSDAADHVLVITPSAGGLNFAVPTGLVPATVRPVRVSAPSPGRPAQRFWGAGRTAGLVWGARGAYRGGDAERHVYDAITLFDPARLGASRQPYSFWGFSRWGRPPFEAQLRLDVPLTRGPFEQGYGKPWGRRFWRRADMTPLWRALAALKVSQAYRDTVWVDLRLHEPVQFSPGLRFGDPSFTKFGDLRKLPT